MVKILTLATVLAAFLAQPALAQQQQSCGKRDAVLQHLAERYAETPVAIGLSESGAVLEILASEEGSWTILKTLPTGVTCFADAGQAFERIVTQPTFGPAS